MDPRTAPFVVIDVETTGLAPAHERVCEVGAIRMIGGKEEGRFQSITPNDPGGPGRIPVFNGHRDRGGGPPEPDRISTDHRGNSFTTEHDADHLRLCHGRR